MLQVTEEHVREVQGLEMLCASTEGDAQAVKDLDEAVKAAHASTVQCKTQIGLKRIAARKLVPPAAVGSAMQEMNHFETRLAEYNRTLNAVRIAMAKRRLQPMPGTGQQQLMLGQAALKKSRLDYGKAAPPLATPSAAAFASGGGLPPAMKARLPRPLPKAPPKAAPPKVAEEVWTEVALKQPPVVEDIEEEIVSFCGLDLGLVQNGKPPCVLDVEDGSDMAGHGVRTDDLLAAIDGRPTGGLPRQDILEWLRAARVLRFSRAGASVEAGGESDRADGAMGDDAGASAEEGQVDMEVDAEDEGEEDLANLAPTQSKSFGAPPPNRQMAPKAKGKALGAFNPYSQVAKPKPGMLAPTRVFALTQGPATSSYASSQGPAASKAPYLAPASSKGRGIAGATPSATPSAASSSALSLKGSGKASPSQPSGPPPKAGLSALLAQRFPERFGSFAGKAPTASTMGTPSMLGKGRPLPGPGGLAPTVGKAAAVAAKVRASELAPTVGKAAAVQARAKAAFAFAGPARPGGGGGGGGPAAEEGETRVDPADGQAYSFEGLADKFEGTYTPDEMQTYWDTEMWTKERVSAEADQEMPPADEPTREDAIMDDSAEAGGAGAGAQAPPTAKSWGAVARRPAPTSTPTSTPRALVRNDGPTLSVSKAMPHSASRGHFGGAARVPGGPSAKTPSGAGPGGAPPSWQSGGSAIGAQPTGRR